MTLNEISEQAEMAVDGANPMFRSSSSPGPEKQDSGPSSVNTIEDEGGQAEAAAVIPPSVTSVEDEVNHLEAVEHVPSSITSVEEEVNHLQMGGGSERTSLSGSSMASTIAPLPRFDKFQSLTTPSSGAREPGFDLQSLPPTLAASLRRTANFPKYKRQYKVESIYVNDLYTLTYDDDETLESIKAIEVHYRRNDREEIRRKLAMGVDDDQFLERPYRKPSLHSRLQSGMNLQICFMNETASDCESQCSDTESTQDRDIDTDRVSTTSTNSKASTPQPTRTRTSNSESDIREKEIDFFARQAQLQAEARLALAQAKEMARMQMEIEKQQRKKSPIAEIVRESFHKIGVPFPDSKRRISRQILTDMNVAQLQVIANDLHTQIESLNEDLVTLLMERDDLHMEQDSMLVDIEDLTKHIGAKELSLQRSTDSKDETKTSWTTSQPPRSKSNSMRLKVKK